MTQTQIIVSIVWVIVFIALIYSVGCTGKKK